MVMGNNQEKGRVFFLEKSGPDFPGETFRVLKEKEDSNKSTHPIS
jgi:hypothetical protein